MTSYERSSDKNKVLVTCDAGGSLIASDLMFSHRTGKVEKVIPFFKKKAHDNWISKVERYKNTDIIITASHDTSIM